MIYKTEQLNNEEYAAVFRKRSDADWDLVALIALDRDMFPALLSREPIEVAGLLAYRVSLSGDDALIQFFSDPSVPSVLVKDVTNVEPWHFIP